MLLVVARNFKCVVHRCGNSTSPLVFEACCPRLLDNNEEVVSVPCAPT